MTAAVEAPARAAPPPQAVQGPIVPYLGVVAVAAVLAALVISIAGNWLWALDFFHVVAGGLWTAIDLFMGFVIGPILARLEIPARTALTRRLMPVMLLLMPTLVLLTLASGWQLARHVGFLDAGSPAHWWLVASFAVVGVMAIVAYCVLEPANISVLLELRKPQPNGALIGRLMGRFIYTAAVTGAMQLATLVIMTRVATL